MVGRPVDPWEQRDGESAKAFEAFKVYRDLGAKRSITLVCERLDKTRALIGRWSAKYQWVTRAAAWDREDDRKFLAEQRYARKSIARKQQRMVGTFQSKLLQRLNTLDPSELSAAELIRWLEITTKIEAQSAEVDLDTKAYKQAQAESDNPTARYETMPDEERRERLAALQREIADRMRIGSEELEKGEQVRVRDATFLDEFEKEHRGGGNYAIDHRGESA